MSDFLYSSLRLPEGSLREVLARWLEPTPARVVEYARPWGTLAVVRLPNAPDPVWEDDSGLTVLAGKPIVRPPSGSPGGVPSVPDRRGRLHRMLLDGRAQGWEDLLDGPFAALALRTRTRGVFQESWPIWEELVESTQMNDKLLRNPLYDTPLIELFEDFDAGAAMRRWHPFARLTALQLSFLTRR